MPRWTMLFALLLLAAACTPTTPPAPASTKAPAGTPKPAAASATAAPKIGPTTAPAFKPTGGSIKIGFLTPLSGPMAGWGHTHKYGPLIAVDDININNGGINGSPVELIMYDSPFDPKQAVSLVRKLAEQDKVVAILGPYASSEFEVAAPLANELQVPVITTAATKAGIAGANRPWAFSFGLSDDYTLPPAIAVFKKTYPNVKKVVISGDTKSAVNEPIVKQLYAKLLKDAGFEVLGTVAFDTGTTDFGAIVTKIKDFQPAGLAISALGPEALLLAKELARQGVRAPAVLSGHIWAGASFAVQGQEAVEGWIGAGFVDEEDIHPRMQLFIARFRQLAGADPKVLQPPFATNEPQAYDAVIAVAEIMRQGKVTGATPLPDARTIIRDGLKGLSGFPGLVGKLTMQPSGEVTWAPAPLIVRSGWWKAVK